MPYQQQELSAERREKKERARKWRLENRERDNARRMKYREAHPEMQKRHYKKNAESIKAKAAKWRKQNRVRANQTRKLWRSNTDSWRPLARRRARIQQMRKNDESKQNATLSYELWDDAQDAYLVEHRATQTTLEMAKALGRTYNAVRRRMGRLGIGQNDKLTTAQKRHERRMMDFNDEWRSIIPVNPW